ncbi:MAG: hypothetical protein ACOZIN_20320 [Myxococcota bacterium]
MSRTTFLLFALMAVACERPRFVPDGGRDDGGSDAGTDAARPAGQMPPTGYSVVVEQPTNLGASNRIGASVAMVLDQNEQPFVAYVHEDPNGDGIAIDTCVELTRWNGVDKAWEAPRTVDVVGQIDTSHPHRQVAIARDSVTGVLAVAYLASATQVNLALSDDEGENWSIETASAPGNETLNDPVLALYGGEVHLAYHQANQRCTGAQCGAVLYRSRLASGAFSSATAVPLLAGTDANPAKPIAMALDADGKPGLAYFLETTASPTVTLAFWRPGTATAGKVVDSEGQVDIDGSVSLTFRGNTPHLAYHLAGSDPAAQLRYSAGLDVQGLSFAAPVAIPRNGAVSAPEGTRWYQSIDLDANGRVAIVASFESATQPAQQCGGPKLARSTDGTTFTVCSPDGGRFFGYAGKWATLYFDRANKLNLVFLYEQRANPQIKPGVLLWREP